MTVQDKPLILSAPQPRSLDLIFTPEAKSALYERYNIVELEPEALNEQSDDLLGRASYVLGQPPINPETLAKLTNLKAVFNVEGNFFDNMPYETLFTRGIHALITGSVFAEPVAEMGLALALNLARGIIDADNAFREGQELWGGDGNTQARLLGGSDIGFIGFGDLGRALNRLLEGFRANVRVFDPWLPQSVLREHRVTPASLDEVLSQSDFIFVVASVTSENQGFLAANEFAKMRKGAALILLSRAAVVDFPDFVAAAKSGHILAASDVYPVEPPGHDDPVRSLPGFIRSAHRAGALDIAFKRMGDMVLEDMDLLDRGLPPMRCKRAERETVSRMRSKPVDKS